MTFDNATGATRDLATTTSETTRLASPTGLPQAAGAMIRVDLSADHPEHESWGRPIETYFRREGDGWKLVGLFRLPGA
jgi:hypothetical protein